MRSSLEQSDKIIIFSPVYNGGFLAHLKNTLDWLSLSYSDKRYNALFKDKNVAVITSVRGLGGNAQAAFELLSAQLSNYSLKVFDEFHLITNKEHQNEELIEDNKEIFDDIKKFVFRFLDF
jgi:NAD(P)H-dependent FMN reductase